MVRGVNGRYLNLPVIVGGYCLVVCTGGSALCPVVLLPSLALSTATVFLALPLRPTLGFVRRSASISLNTKTAVGYYPDRYSFKGY